MSNEEKKPLTLQQMMNAILNFWDRQGCIIHQGYDLEVGAGTFNPATFLRSLGPEPYRAAYVEPSRRPQDGRYGLHPNRLQNYHQLQVILKPVPENFQQLFLESLETIGLNLKEHDIRFVHDDWENPTIGAWGLGWEVWLNGMEITQITYFQAVGSCPLSVISGEITYGIERIAMYLQKKDSVYDVLWNDALTYGDVVHSNEKAWSYYNFDSADTEMWSRHFEDFSKEALRTLQDGLPVPAYDFVIKASHAFNILDARGMISVTERTRYIARIRQLARAVADAYIAWREHLQHPLIKDNASILPTLPQAPCPSISAEEDLVIEIGSEELPATFVPIGISDLEKSAEKLLKEYSISYKDLQVWGSPRRLTLFLKQVSPFSHKEKTEKKGPPLSSIYDENGLITENGEKFFASLNNAPLSLESLKASKYFSIKEIKGIPYLFITSPEQTFSTAEILSEHIPSIINNIKFPKKMTWDTSKLEYPRPIRWILALYGSQVLPIKIGNISSSNISYGHRQLCNSKISIYHASEYETSLSKAFVIVSQQHRKQMILETLSQICESKELSVVEKKSLCEETSQLCEHPFVIAASFPEEFCSLPVELLTAEMVQHQKYFPLKKVDGSLSNIFAVVCDTKPNETIVTGNERALLPRLTDGKFLFEQDLKTPLDTFVDKLKLVTFIEPIGSLYSKVERLKLHGKSLHTLLESSASWNDLELGLQYCKADLTSSVVGEFPELQGIMGRYYSQNVGFPAAVSQGIGEHLSHITENSVVTEIGALISLADRFDNLLSCFSLDLRPSSSQDPYALRRQALEILVILQKLNRPLNLEVALEQCASHFGETLHISKEIISEIVAFIFGRLKSLLGSLGYSKEEIAATLTTSSPLDPVTLIQQISELKHFKTNKPNSFENILSGYKRLRKILSSLGNSAVSTPLREELLNTSEEKELLQLLYTSSNTPFSAYLHNLELLATTIHNLLDNVRINQGDDETIEARKALLLQALQVFLAFYDLERTSK